MSRASAPQPHSKRSKGTPRRARRPLVIPWRKLAPGAALFLGVMLLIYLNVDIDEVHAYADRLPAGIAFALLAFLPLFGFPASLLHIAAGIRFGIPLGLALVSLSILFQLFVSYAVTHWQEERFSRWLAPVRERIPQGAHGSVCVLTVLLPGVPYAAINYVLPLLGVPLRTYILACWPLHTLRSTVTVAFGGQSHQLTTERVLVLVAYALTILGASWWTYRRMRARLGGQPAAGGGRTQAA